MRQIDQFVHKRGLLPSLLNVYRALTRRHPRPTRCRITPACTGSALDCERRAVTVGSPRAYGGASQIGRPTVSVIGVLICRCEGVYHSDSYASFGILIRSSVDLAAPLRYFGTVPLCIFWRQFKEPGDWVLSAGRQDVLGPQHWPTAFGDAKGFFISCRHYGRVAA